MIFRIGGVKKFLGVSAETLRFFEKKGVLVPKRNKENNYRYYDGRDINNIIGYRFFRSLDFSMEESINLIQHYSNKEASLKVEAQEKLIAEKIQQYQIILKRLAFQRKLYHRAETMVNQFLIEELPAYIFYYNQKNRIFDSVEVEKEYTQTWVNAMPQTMVAFHIPQEKILTPGLIHWGHALQLDHQPLSQDPNFYANLPYTIKSSKQTTVFTVIKCTNQDLKTEGRFDSLLQYITQHHMVVDGDIFGTIINHQSSQHHTVSHFAVWIPVKNS
jgi:DNA-binding transcriptional MerR regulator